MKSIRMTVTEASRVVGADGEASEMRCVAPGCLRGGVLTYTTEADGAKVFHRVDLREVGRVTVTRSGAIVSELVFSVGERHASVYRIPPFSFDMEIVTRSLSVSMSEAGGSIRLCFASRLGGAEQETELTVSAVPRGEGEP